MTGAFLDGARIYLRPLEIGDAGPEYLSWLNDAETTRYLEVGRHPTTLADLRAYIEDATRGADRMALAIVERKTDAHIGNVTLNNIHPVHRRADTGLLIGRKDLWGKGYAREAWSLVIDYAFTRLNIHKLIAGAVVDNVASIAVLQKLGFRIEGTLREDVFVEAAYRDVVRLGLLAGEFKPANGARRGDDR